MAKIEKATNEATKVIFKFNQNSNRVISSMKHQRSAKAEQFIDEELLRIQRGIVPVLNLRKDE